MRRPCPSIVVFHVGWIGDGIVALPVLEAIRRRFAEGEIHLVGSDFMEPFYDGCPWIDRFIPYRRSTSLVARGRRLLQEIRTHRPDIFINLHTPDFGRPRSQYLRDHLFALATGAAARLGYADALTNPLLTHPVPLTHFGSGHILDDLSTVAAPISEPIDIERVVTWWSVETDHDPAAARHGTLFLCPFAKRWEKELRVPDWREIVRPFAEAERPLAIVCAPTQRQRARAWADELALPCRGSDRCDAIAVCTPPLQATADLLRRGMVLSVDSGLAHLASLVRAPSIIFFGPTTPERWRPLWTPEQGVFRVRTRAAPGTMLAPGYCSVDTEPPWDAIHSRVASHIGTLS